MKVLFYFNTSLKLTILFTTFCFALGYTFLMPYLLCYEPNSLMPAHPYPQFMLSYCYPQFMPSYPYPQFMPQTKHTNAMISLPPVHAADGSYQAIPQHSPATAAPSRQDPEDGDQGVGTP